MAERDRWEDLGYVLGAAWSVIVAIGGWLIRRLGLKRGDR